MYIYEKMVYSYKYNSGSISTDGQSLCIMRPEEWHPVFVHTLSPVISAGLPQAVRNLKYSCWLALQMGQLDVARMLIEGGADLTTENMIGETPEKRLINSHLVTSTSDIFEYLLLLSEIEMSS